MRRAYLDHASTSPLRPAARDAMVDALDRLCGDPSRMHQEALVTREALEQARQHVADLLGATARSVVFTSGATESIAAATWGATQRSLAKGGGAHQVVSAVEHSAVLADAERSGPVTVVGVDGTGRVDPAEVIAAMTPETALVHLQWGNHEIGTIQPLAEVVAACRERKVLVHVDAAQAVGRVPVAFDALGADLLSFSGHKFGAPTGTGGLLVRKGLRIDPLLLGGDQERARRAGIEPVAALVGLGAAAADVQANLDAEAATATRQTDRVRAGAAEIDGVQTYGSTTHRLPHLVCLGIDGVEPQGVLLGLDRAGVAAHSGSACASESLEPSPVLAALGVDAHRSLRISVGWSTTDADIDLLLTNLAPNIERLLSLGRIPPGT